MLLHDRNDICYCVIEDDVKDQVAGRQILCSSTGKIKCSCIKIYTGGWHLQSLSTTPYSKLKKY